MSTVSFIFRLIILPQSHL